MKIGVASVSLVAFGVFAGSAWGQEAGVAVDVQRGHSIAINVCSNCHIASPDQAFQPLLQPPAPSFESIAQRNNISAESVRTFLSTTHRSISNPRAMPNPQLIDSHINQVTAYLLSLRKQRPVGQQGEKGEPGTPGIQGPPGQPGGTGQAGPGAVHIVRTTCDAASCVAQCADDEIVISAWCGAQRNPSNFPTEKSATCRGRGAKNNPLIAVCAKLAGP